MEERIRVCSYSRVSTNKEEQKRSLEHQRKDFEDYFDNNPKYEYANQYFDTGLTGTTVKKREDFKKMLVDCGLEIKNVENISKTKTKIAVIASDRKPLYKYIFVSNTSRFGRNLVEVSDIVRELRSVGVYVIFKDRGLSTENLNDMAFLQHMFQFDEMESSDKSHKVKAGHRKSANTSDKIHTNGRIYGYQYDKENNRLIKDNKEAENVQKIFELYAESLGIRKILNYLRDNNIRTREGKEFSKSTIGRILANEKYAGINARMKYDTGVVLENKHSPKLKAKDEWIFVKTDKIQPIISKELFYECQAKRKSNTSQNNKKGMHRGNPEYAGLIKCQLCGSSYIRNIDRGRVFFNCSLKKTKGIKECSNVNISLKHLEREIEDYCNYKFKEEVESNQREGWYRLKDIEERLMMKIDNDSEQLVELKRRELDSSYEILMEYSRQVANKQIPQNIFEKLNIETRERIDILEKEIIDLSKTNDEIMQDIRVVHDVMQGIDRVQIKEEYSKEELLNEIQVIRVMRTLENPYEATLEFTFKKSSMIQKMTTKVETAY